jgi:hypothetical protein
VIRTPDEIPITLVPKERFGVTDTYVDTRNWTVNDAAKHPALVQKLINVGKADVLRHIVPDTHAAANASSTTASSVDLSRLLDEAIRSAQRDARDKAAPPSTATQAARGILGWF